MYTNIADTYVELYINLSILVYIKRCDMMQAERPNQPKIEIGEQKQNVIYLCVYFVFFSTHPYSTHHTYAFS